MKPNKINISSNYEEIMNDDIKGRTNLLVYKFIEKFKDKNNFNGYVQSLIDMKYVSKKEQLMVTFYYDLKWESVMFHIYIEFKFLFKVSDVFFKPIKDKPSDAVKLFDEEDLYIHAIKSPHPECKRCRLHDKSVDDHIDYKTGLVDYAQICFRCVQHIIGYGEPRYFF